MDSLDYYRRHGRVTEPGPRHQFGDLPHDVPALAGIIGGVMVHRDWTEPFGFTLPTKRRDEANTRSVAAILDALGSLDERRPEERFAGTCRDFAVMLCAMLRETGVPACARAGFAGYFTDGFFDDHWVVDVWDDQQGWHLVDAQLASAPPGTYTNAAIDPLDVSRDAFLVGGQAWQECRAGGRDLNRIGTSAGGLVGLWEVQGNVIRDLAALNRVETLPWDEWGLIPIHYDQLEPADLDLLDTAAAVGARGCHTREAAEIYRSDPRLVVPTALTADTNPHHENRVDIRSVRRSWAAASRPSRPTVRAAPRATNTPSPVPTPLRAPPGG